MARRNSTKSTDIPQSTNEVEETTVSTEENTDTVAEATTEAPATEAPVTDEKAEVVFDLTAFQAAADSAVENADDATGEVAPLFLDPVLKEYRLLEGIKAKNAAKKLLTDAMKDQMNQITEPGAIQKARSYLQLSEGMSAGSAAPKGPKAPKAPVDPAVAFIAAEATLRLALVLHPVPEGVEQLDADEKAQELVDGSLEQAQAYLAWVQSDAEDKGEAPEASAVVLNAVKLALGKSAKAGSVKSGGGSSPYTGTRRDIAKHIQQAFEGAEAGEFKTVSEIRNTKSDEYGDDAPSAGAISIRLFPKGGGDCTVEGVNPTEQNGKKGAVKA